MGKCARCGKKKHYDWYKEWGKTIRPKSNTTPGPALGVLPLGLPFAEWQSARNGATGPLCPTCSPSHSPASRPAVTRL